MVFIGENGLPWENDPMAKQEADAIAAQHAQDKIDAAPSGSFSASRRIVTTMKTLTPRSWSDRPKLKVLKPTVVGSH